MSLRNWEPFLKRPVFTHRALSSTLLSGKTVLLTGAGGSIGSAVARLLMGGLAKRLILLDRSAKRLLDLQKTYQERHIVLPQVDFIQADILDAGLVQEMCRRNPPDVILHTAALKHLVPLESNPFGALETNVLGTIRVLKLADFFHVQHFVNVSTDKAVNPTSILGVSKRISELLLQAADFEPFCKQSLRLGNVLESSDSLVPTFIRSVENNQPFTLTDPEAKRYFITLEEAANFLLETLNIRDSALLVPEMGSPRKIVDLITFLMHDLDRDVSTLPIVQIGMRDGEKKSEHLIYDYEHRRKTIVPHLYEIVGSNVVDREKFAYKVSRMLDLVVRRQINGLVEVLQEVVPEFQPSATVLSRRH